MTAALVIAFVIDAMRNSESVCIGCFVAGSLFPTACKYPTRPCRETAATAPAMRPSSTSFCRYAVMLFNASAERPISAGSARFTFGVCWALALRTKPVAITTTVAAICKQLRCVYVGVMSQPST